MIFATVVKKDFIGMNFIPKRALKIKNGWAQCLSKDRQKIVSYHFTTFMMFKDVLLHTFYLGKKVGNAHYITVI